MFSLLGVELCFSLFLFLWFFMMCFVLIYLCMNNICFLFSWELFNCSSSSVNFDLLLDWMSCSFSGLVCFISGCVMIFSMSYMSGDSNYFRFTLMVMLFVLSMNFLIFIPSMVSLLLGWDGLGLVSFCLVIYYQNNKSLAAGMLTVLMNRVGDCFILGVISILMVLGHWNMMCFWDFMGFELVNFFIMLAGMTKSAQIPFSSWLPAAMAAPTPVSALVHSSTLVTAGVYLFIRFFNYLTVYYWFNIFMVYISIMTTVMSGICALYEYDMKKIIALSTLSQLGVMMMSLGLGMPMMALFHLYTHAMFKALLFMCGGNIIHCFSGKQDMRQIGSVSKVLPVTCVFLNIANMALCGMPFLAGFYSKDLIVEGLVSGNMNLFTLLLGLFGVCLTVLYSGRFSLLIIWGNESSEVYSNIKDNDVKMIFPMSMLVLGAMFGGVIFQSLFSSFYLNIFLPMSMKLIIPLLIFMSLVGMFGLWGKGLNVNILSVLSYINSGLWFMNSFVCYPLLQGFKSLSNSSLKSVDMGWFEILGGQGLFNLNKLSLTVLEYWLVVAFNCYMLIFVVFIMFL